MLFFTIVWLIVFTLFVLPIQIRVGVEAPDSMLTAIIGFGVALLLDVFFDLNDRGHDE